MNDSLTSVALEPRTLRCSSVEYSRYSPSSRLDCGAPSRPRVDAVIHERALRSRGETYVAQFITADELAAILAAPREMCGR
jgi:hypothetical protein